MLVEKVFVAAADVGIVAAASLFGDRKWFFHLVAVVWWRCRRRTATCLVLAAIATVFVPVALRYVIAVLIPDLVFH